MPFDLSDHLARMTRRVEHDERDDQPTKRVVASRVYPTDPDDLWDALTRPERLSRWFLPISGDLRPGGSYQFEGNAGGAIERCEPPETIAVTWEYGGGTSWLTVVLTPEGAGTRLSLQHEAPVDPDFDAQFGPGAVGVGWDLGFMGLARHLADPGAERPPEADEGWAASEEARAFHRTAADAWGRAAIEAGTPADQATAAAERTRAFYSGEAAPGEAPDA